MTKKRDNLRSIQLSTVELELFEGGSGHPILFLHPWIGLDPELPFLSLLAEKGHLVAPFHPGFSRSTLPRHYSTVDDLAYFYLDLLEHFDFRDCVVVGVSFGAWIAAEIAIKCCDRIGALVLADPVGIKTGGPDDVEIVDHFSLSFDQFAELAYADPAHWNTPSSGLSDKEAEIIARNRDAAALFGWLPYMYDPKLANRLYRIQVPTKVIKGRQDRVISENYAERFAELLPNGHLEEIAECGHFPHIEQPQQLVEKICEFIG